MILDFAYGDEMRGLVTPSEAAVDYIVPRPGDPVDDIDAALASACAAPVEGASLSSRLERAGSGVRVLVIIADLTRSPATRVMLPALVARLESHGVERDHLRVLVARGTHRSLTREERRILRAGPLKGIAVHEHDCDDGSSLSALLLTKRKTPVRIHRAVREADVVILLSPISFHYFAGFGGGRKLILPGCADRDAILANHRLSIRDTKPVTLHPSCRPGNLEGNPVHEDMLEAVQSLAHLFAINFFTDLDGGVTFVNAGDPVYSHEEACREYAARFGVRIAAPAPVVIASAGGWPHDINLLQAHKALFHAGRAAADGGHILLFAKCGEGVGSKSLAAALALPRKEYLERAYEDYALNNQTAVSLAALTSRFRVAMVTELGDETLSRAGIERCSNVEAWVAEALEDMGSDRIAIVPHAAVVLPAVKE